MPPTITGPVINGNETPESEGHHLIKPTLVTAAVIHSPPRDKPPPPPVPAVAVPVATPIDDVEELNCHTINNNNIRQSLSITAPAGHNTITPNTTTPTTNGGSGTTAITTRTTNPVTLPVVVVAPLDSNHELETSLSTVSASTSTPSSSPVAANKATTAADSVNNNNNSQHQPQPIQHISEPSYQNTAESQMVAIAAGGIISAAAEAGIVEVSSKGDLHSKEENNNNRTSLDQMNGHGRSPMVGEEVDGVPKSPSVDTRNNNVAALGESPTAKDQASVPSSAPAPVAAPTGGAISKEGNDKSYSHLERLYDNQEMVIRMMTANLGRTEEQEEEMNALHMLGQFPQQPPPPLHPMYDIPVSPLAGE